MNSTAFSLKCNALNPKVIMMAVGVLMSWIATPLAFAADTATTTITGKVVAVCNVTIPATISLEDLPHYKPTTENIVLKYFVALPFKISGGCSGVEKTKYTFTAVSGTSRINCLQTVPADTVQVCLYDEKNILYFGKNKTFSKEVENNSDLTLIIRLISAGNPKVGTYTASLSVKIEPM